MLLIQLGPLHQFCFFMRRIGNASRETLQIKDMRDLFSSLKKVIIAHCIQEERKFEDELREYYTNNEVDENVEVKQFCVVN